MNYTPEQQADFEERAKGFQVKFDELYKGLKEEFECELVYGVATVPSPAGIFGLGVNQSIGDLKYKATPSPEEFIPKDA